MSSVKLWVRICCEGDFAHYGLKNARIQFKVARDRSKIARIHFKAARDISKIARIHFKVVRNDRLVSPS